MFVSCIQSAVYWATSLLSANLRYRACIFYLHGANVGVTLEARGGADSTGMTAVGLMKVVALLSLSHYQKPRC